MSDALRLARGKERYSVAAMRWGQLKLVDHHFRPLAPFRSEEEAVQAVLHLLNRDDAFRKRYDGWTFVTIGRHAAVLVGDPQTLRVMRGAA